MASEYVLNVLSKENFGGIGFSVYGSKERPWVVADDVAKLLGYREAWKIMGFIDDEEDKEKRMVYHGGQMREMWLISEYGLYDVCAKSGKPEAREFRRVVKAVMSRLRTHGSVTLEEAYARLSEDKRERLERMKIRKVTDKREIAEALGVSLRTVRGWNFGEFKPRGERLEMLRELYPEYARAIGVME